MQLHLAASTARNYLWPEISRDDVTTELPVILGRLWSHIVEPILRNLKVGYFTFCPCLQGADHNTVAPKARGWQDAAH
jgi:hypothetical protein